MSTRLDNVTSARWSANGKGLGSPDLTVTGNQVFGADVSAPRCSVGGCRGRHQEAQAFSKGLPLDGELADEVAHGIKEWALERGATHYTHWFQPQTGHRGKARRVLLV